jgi:outer membrane protein
MPERRDLRNLQSSLRLLMFALICLVLTGQALAQSVFPSPGWFKQNVSRPPVDEKSKAFSEYLNSLNQEGKLKLTQADAIRLVLENNLDVVVDRFDPRLSVYDIESAYRLFDPKFSTVLGVGFNKDPQPSAFISGSNIINTLGHRMNFGYSQLFETGTRFQVDFQNSRSSSNSARNNVNPYYYSALTASLSQPLLRNFGFLPNTRLIKIARNNKEISEHLFAQRVIEMVNQVQNSYWEIVFQKEDIKVKQRSLDLATKTNEDNKRQVEIGTLAPIEIVKSESEIANRQEDLIRAEFTLQELEDQMKKLISRYGDPGQVTARIDPVDSTLPPTALKDFDLAQAVAYAIEARPEIKQLRKQIDNNEINVKYTRNQLLPNVELSVSYGTAALEGTIRQYTIDPISGLPITGPILSQTGWGGAISRLFQGDFPNYGAQVTLEIPLRNRAAQADYAYASVAKRRAENNLKAAEQQVALQVRNAYTILEMDRATIAATQKARELAEKNLDAEQKKFQLGTSTIRFVLEEQRNLAVAQSNELRSLVDFTKAKSDLDKSMGKTLEANNISITDALSGDTTSFQKPPQVASRASGR